MAPLETSPRLDEVLTALRVVDVAVICVVILAAVRLLWRLRSAGNKVEPKGPTPWIVGLLVLATGVHLAGEFWFRDAMSARAHETTSFADRSQVDWSKTQAAYMTTLGSVDSKMIIAFRGSAPVQGSDTFASPVLMGRYAATWSAATLIATCLIAGSLVPVRRPRRAPDWGWLGLALAISVANLFGLMLGADEYIGLVDAVRS